jgi:hypothetical protein
VASERRRGAQGCRRALVEHAVHVRSGRRAVRAVHVRVGRGRVARAERARVRAREQARELERPAERAQDLRLARRLRAERDGAGGGGHGREQGRVDRGRLGEVRDLLRVPVVQHDPRGGEDVRRAALRIDQYG